MTTAIQGFRGLAALLLLTGVMGACTGEAMLGSGLESWENDPFAPCTDALRCCPREELSCWGDPDTGMTCSCTGLWDCGGTPDKCFQDKQVPGAGTWNCTWSADAYVCEGRPETPPTGGNGWSCQVADDEFHWVCRRDSPPNPSNQPEGTSVWSCEVDNVADTIRCERVDDLPPGSGSNTPPEETPPESEEDGAPPFPWFPWPPWPSQGQECVPDTKMWCDGLQYCGWGQVVCGPDGHWKRRGLFGLGGLDCQELPDGRRPNTVCACYHTYFNKACCEQPDCIVPAGSNGQICPASAGELCDYCNPLNPECKGGKCIVTNSNETFCGLPCANNQPCPQGYSCLSLTTKSGNTLQCVPDDYSCFY